MSASPDLRKRGGVGVGGGGGGALPRTMSTWPRPLSQLPQLERVSADGERAEIASREPTSGGPVRRCVRFVVTCVVIHYLFWLFAVVGLTVAVALAASGGRAWVAAAAVALEAAMYAPSFLDGSSYRLGRPWDAFRHWAGWRLGHEYVGLRVVRTARLDGGGAGGGAGGGGGASGGGASGDAAAAPQYVFGWHPHGILILSRMAMYGGVFEALFPGIETRVLGATPIFFWPGSREVSLWLGAVDASMATAKRVLAAGLSVIVYPGGSKEIFKTDRRSSETVLELRERTGFVRLAMQHGAPLVPVVVFNERYAYERVDVPTWLRDLCLRTLRVPVLLFYGRFGLLPFRLSLGVVFGRPMPVEHVPDIAKDDPRVAATHARYMEALRKLWEDEKAGFGYGPEDTLHIK